MSAVQYSIVSPSGDELRLATHAADPSPFGLLVGSSGLGLAPRDLRIVTSASRTGGRVRAIRYPPRSATLVVTVSSEGGLEDNVRRLATAIRSVDGQPMPMLRGEVGGDVYELPFVFESGGEDAAAGSGSSVLELPLNVIFPDPFWTARDSTSFAVAGLTGTDGLLPRLAELPLTSATAVGGGQITNPGDVPALPTWRLTGPATNVTATSGARSWNLGPLAVGEVVIVDAATCSARLVGAAPGTENVYTRFGPAPKFFPIPPGTSRVDVAIEGATADSGVVCFYRPRREVIL